MAVTNINSASDPSASSPGKVTPRKYQIIISVESEEVTTTGSGGTWGRAVFPIVANLPERFHIQYGSSWSTPFARTDAAGFATAVGRQFGGQAVGNAAGAAVSGAGGVLGISPRLKGQGVQVWENSSGLTFNVDLIFYVEKNTDREIRQRQVALLKLCAPSTFGGAAGNAGVLRAPGPKLIEKSGSVEGRIITVLIGDYIRIPNVIITDVGTDVISLMDERGIPIAMSLNLSFQTWNTTVTAEDIEEMFYGASGE